MDLPSLLRDALVLAPLTRGSNLPYRRLCVEQGARITTSEMCVVYQLRKGRKLDFAILRRAPEETCYGVQLLGNKVEDMAWAAALAEERGADFVDVNVGCPIDAVTRFGQGAALGRQPRKVREIVEAMRNAVKGVPVTAKIRLGWTKDLRNHLDQARAIADGGASALFVHGRTRAERYRGPVDWEAIGEIVQAVSIPVIGNGDLLFPVDFADARARSGCAGLMVGRGALIKPWIFREATEGPLDVPAEARLALYRRYRDLCREHWGDHDKARTVVRGFLAWHLGFWCRYRRAHEDGTFPRMSIREPSLDPRSPLEALLGRSDRAAVDWLADRLLLDEEIDPEQAPPPGGGEVEEADG